MLNINEALKLKDIKKLEKEIDERYDLIQKLNNRKYQHEIYKEIYNLSCLRMGIYDADKI